MRIPVLILALSISFSASAGPKILCDLSVTRVVKDKDENGKEYQVWDSAQWQTPFIYVKAFPDFSDRLTADQIRKLKMDGRYLKTEDGKSINVDFAILDGGKKADQALAFHNIYNPRPMLEAGYYAAITSKQVNDSVFIQLAVFNMGQIQLSGEAIMNKKMLAGDERGFFLVGNSNEYSALIAQYPDASELELYQKLTLGSFAGFHISCDSYGD